MQLEVIDLICRRCLEGYMNSKQRAALETLTIHPVKAQGRYGYEFFVCMEIDGIKQYSGKRGTLRDKTQFVLDLGSIVNTLLESDGLKDAEGLYNQ